jgi:hypothetical protein
VSKKLVLARDLRELLEAALSLRTPLIDRRNAITVLRESLQVLDEELAEEVRPSETP